MSKMKTTVNLISVLFVIFIFSYSANAQCSSCNYTFTAPGSTTLDLSSNNKTYCLTGSGEYSGNITLSGNNSILCIGENVILTGSISINSSSAEVNNYGTINTSSISFSGTINNYGNLQINGDLIVHSSGNLNNYNITYGGMEINGALNINNGADMIVQGTVVINGNVTVDNGGEISLEGAGLDIDGDLIVTGKINGDGSTTGCNGLSYSGTGTINSGGKLSDLDVCKSSAPADTDETGSGVTQCNCSAVTLLPVKYSSITASYLNYEQVTKINWKTTIEKDNNYFIIEKSVDGYVFNQIGKVNAYSTLATENQYYFFDKAILFGTAYYRLIQVDKDGNSSISKVIVVNNKHTPLNMAITHVAQDILEISVNKTDIKGNLLIHNVLGEVLYDQLIEIKNNRLPIKVANMPSKQLYIIVFRGKDFSFSKKMLFN